MTCILQRIQERMFSLTVLACIAITFLRDNQQQQQKQQQQQQQKQHPSSICLLEAQRNNESLWKPRMIAFAKDGWSTSIHVVVAEPAMLGSNGNGNSNSGKHHDHDVDQCEIPGILDSDDLYHGKNKPEPMYDENCVPLHDWQVGNFPTCNVLHERDMTDWFLVTTQQRQPFDDNHDEHVRLEKVRFIASGGYRHVFMIRDDYSYDHVNSAVALKTLKYSRNFTERDIDRHRRDAMAAARLTATPESLDIYAYCGNSAIYQFAHGGTLKNAIAKYIFKPGTHYTKSTLYWDSNKKLRVAYQVAASIAAVHNVDEEGRASIAHTDISTDQFVSIDLDLTTFKINDFNRARFLRQQVHNSSINCPFVVKSNRGRFRSPEEYNQQPETEAVDVYSMGNIFYVLVTGRYPWEHLSRKQAGMAVASGRRPDFGRRLEKSHDANVQALITAANMCWAQNPKERATARQVQLFLQSKLPP